MTSFTKLYWIRHFGGTRRFHVERFIGEQTVFHHSASTALLLLQTLGPACSANLLKAALCHDLEEGITGDIPAPAKWACGNTLEALEAKVRATFGIPFPELTAEEQDYLKAADFLDATFTCLEQRLMGNTLIDSVYFAYQRFEKERRLLAKLSGPMLALWVNIQQAYEDSVAGNPASANEIGRIRFV